MRQTGDLATTDMEAAALRFARRRFAETIAALDLMDPFVDVGAAEIDRIIMACVEGFREGMQRQIPQRDASVDETTS